MHSVLETFDINSFNIPVSSEIQRKAVEALEQGKVVYFPRLSFDLQPEELKFLSHHLVDPKSKNISYDVKNDKLGGAICSELEKQKLKEMIRRYAAQSYAFMEKLFPGYMPHLDQARTSFRPVEIAGRANPSYRKDDKLLHVDAFPATPVKGKRIMRFFTNVNPNGQPRIWKLGEPFHQVVQSFGDQIKSPMPGLAWLLKALKITKDYRSLYDHYMMNLHDTMKGDKDYQKNVEQHEIHFPAGSTWIVFTDQASHAAISGQHVMEQTYYLPVDGLDNPETSPLRVLERYYGKKLV